MPRPAAIGIVAQRFDGLSDHRQNQRAHALRLSAFNGRERQLHQGNRAQIHPQLVSIEAAKEMMLKIEILRRTGIDSLQRASLSV